MWFFDIFVSVVPPKMFLSLLQWNKMFLSIMSLMWWWIPVLLQAYSCSADGTVRLWDFTDGILIKVRLLPSIVVCPVLSVSVSSQSAHHTFYFLSVSVFILYNQPITLELNNICNCASAPLHLTGSMWPDNEGQKNKFSNIILVTRPFHCGLKI